MLAKVVSDTCDQGCLGSRDQEVKVVGFSVFDQAGEVGVLDMSYVLALGYSG